MEPICFDPWDERVRPHLHEIVHGLKVDEILDSAFAKRLITKHEYDKIRSQPTDIDKNRSLICDFLMPTKSEPIYSKFISILKKSESCERFASLLSSKKQEDMHSPMGAGSSIESHMAKALVPALAPLHQRFDCLEEKVMRSLAPRTKKITFSPASSRAAVQLPSDESKTDLLMTCFRQAQQATLLPKITKLAASSAQPLKGSVKRETVTVFVPRGYNENRTPDEALEKLFRVHLKSRLNLRLQNADDSFKPEKSLTITFDSVVSVKLTLIGMPASEFGKKSDSLLSLLISVFPKFRRKLRRVDSDCAEFCAEMFSKDIGILGEFFDDEEVQQAFAACLQYQFSSLKEMRVTIGCLPCWTLDIEKASQQHEDFPREGTIKRLK